MSESGLDELYDAARVPDADGSSSRYPGIFVLGCLDRRVSFVAQQIRAINLIHCLEAKKTIAPGKVLAIVGGGVAGSTAAVYAMSRGHCVCMIERHAQPMSLQAGSSRWLHPNIYDWPKQGWNVQSTSLPVMNWTAGPAVNVIGTLRRQWDDAVRRYQPDVHMFAEVANIDGGGPPWMLNWSKGSTKGDAVILAVGFGEERNHDALGSRAYWYDSDFHQRLRNGGLAVVSGCGDGGFIDALRLCLRDFQQQWLAEFGAHPEVLELGHHLLEFERDMDRYGSASALTRAYMELPIPKDVMQELRDRCNSGVHVILNGGHSAPLTRESCVLHRLLIVLLMKLGIIEYVGGKISLDSTEKVNGRYCVRLEDCTVLANDVDVLVLRHGPLSALSGFNDIWGLLVHTWQHYRSRPLLSDMTRRPMWSPTAPQAVAPVGMGGRDSANDPSIFDTKDEAEAGDPAVEMETERAPNLFGPTQVPPSARRSLARHRNKLEELLRAFCVGRGFRCSVNQQTAGTSAIVTAVLEPNAKVGLNLPAELEVEVNVNSESHVDVVARSWLGIPRVPRAVRVIGSGLREINESDVISSLELLLNAVNLEEVK